MNFHAGSIFMLSADSPCQERARLSKATAPERQQMSSGVYAELEHKS